MKRRDFIAKGTAGALTLSASGCSKREYNFTVPEHYKDGVPKGKLGSTDITVSKFGFGSHIKENHGKISKKREHVIRAAFDYGITTFDIYDRELGCYQYKPMGKYLAPVINDVVISVILLPDKDRSIEEELHYALKTFGRDYIDMVRISSYAPNHTARNYKWEWWEDLIRFKEQGKIRALGVPIHFLDDIEYLMEIKYPIDYVIFPFNFYHNIGWPPDKHPGDFVPLATRLREKNISVVTMKPFAGDVLIGPLKEAGKKVNPDISFTRAALRYVINSGLNPDTTFTGMNNFIEFNENITAYLNPEMSDDEREFLEELKKIADKTAQTYLPHHYQFLENWTMKSANDRAVKII